MARKQQLGGADAPIRGVSLLVTDRTQRRSFMDSTFSGRSARRLTAYRLRFTRSAPTRRVRGRVRGIPPNVLHSWALDELPVAWWARDDRGNRHLGHPNGWGGNDESASGTMRFWPALDPQRDRTAARRISADQHQAVFSIPIDTGPMTDWWTGIPAAATTIECGGHIHTLRWEHGELTAVDHDDPKAEATLAALAGETVPCLDRLRAWDASHNDVRVLTLASRGLTDRLDVATDRHAHPQALPSNAKEPSCSSCSRWAAACLTGFRRMPPQRGQGGCSTGHSTLDAALPQLQAALYGRLLLAIRLWLGEPRLSIDLTMVDAGDERIVERTTDAVAVTLPFAWLTEVWARGLTSIFGRLCLGATTEDGITGPSTPSGPTSSPSRNSR